MTLEEARTLACWYDELSILSSFQVGRLTGEGKKFLEGTPLSFLTEKDYFPVKVTFLKRDKWWIVYSLDNRLTFTEVKPEHVQLC